MKGVAEAKWLFQEQLSRLVAEEGALVWEEGQGKALFRLRWGKGCRAWEESPEV